MAVEEGSYIDAGGLLLGVTLGTLVSVLFNVLIYSQSVETEALSTGGEECLDKPRKAWIGEEGYPVAI